MSIHIQSKVYAFGIPSSYETISKGQKVTVEISDKQKSTLKSVLVRIADVCNDDGYGYPSNGRIAHDTELSFRTVQKTTSILERMGIIKKIARYKSNGENTSNGIYVNIPMLDYGARVYSVKQESDNPFLAQRQKQKTAKQINEDLSTGMHSGVAGVHSEVVGDALKGRGGCTQDIQTTNNSNITISNNTMLENQAFDIFWLSGIKKTGCTKSDIKKRLLKAFKYQDEHKTICAFADFLKSDIEYRLKTQFGFNRLLASTYLNQKRWEAEYETDQSAINGSGNESIELQKRGLNAMQAYLNDLAESNG